MKVLRNIVSVSYTHLDVYKRQPQQTRALNSNIVEAHVVMSRGCDWNCTFCTERLELSKGEIRRPITQVKEEILEIAANFPSLRIQFVDDNLFPQIAAFSDKRIKVEHALDWAKELFVTLKDVNNSTKDSFGWRGICLLYTSRCV